ncbi:unnamed protein product [Didymodactylos carnosus]|uniref:Uncharacterized protein n=1 Tax=Didymodactylos carnosus TaxID=1234261 RepID=A0A814QU46_9BILA|nr:unnamed protein product [Didymodactylos carnosus]CAF3887735.1 unnamed protein product [Didymodactylos carnosus]
MPTVRPSHPHSPSPTLNISHYMYTQTYVHQNWGSFLSELNKISPDTFDKFSAGIGMRTENDTIHKLLILLNEEAITYSPSWLNKMQLSFVTENFHRSLQSHMSATYADELAKYNNSEGSLVTNTPNMESFSPNSSQLSFLDEEENTPAHDQLLTLTSVNNNVELVTVPPRLTPSLRDRIEIIRPSTSVNTNNMTSTSFHIRTGCITDETVRNNSNSVTTTTTVRISPISICASLLSSRRWIDSEVQTDLTFETSTIEQDGLDENIEGFRLYKEWWLTMDCKARVHNNKLCKRENCELNHRQEDYCRICNGKSRHMVTQTAFTAVEEEENVIGKYHNEYRQYYRFRNNLALNVYYRENNLFPKSLQIDVPKQNFDANDPKLRQQWLDIIQNASKDLSKCEAQAIERTIAEAEAKCELLRDKLCEMRKEREMMDVEREESVKLKETIESLWNKVFRLEMREISPQKQERNMSRRMM